MLTGYFAATTWANSASATAPVTMSLTPVPEANSAPPVDTWMMPSLPASAKPLIAAFTVSDEVTLIAGYAKPPAFARSRIWAYTSGVATGIAASGGIDLASPRVSRTMLPPASPDRPDAVWYHPEPKDAAEEITDRVAFRRGVEVTA